MSDQKTPEEAFDHIKDALSLLGLLIAEEPTHNEGVRKLSWGKRTDFYMLYAHPDLKGLVLTHTVHGKQVDRRTIQL